MSLTVEVPEELEPRIRQAAARQGQAPAAFVLSTLEERLRSAEPPQDSAPPVDGHDVLVRLFEGIWNEMSEEEIANLPTDLAEEHDHYIYGTPKKNPDNR